MNPYRKTVPLISMGTEKLEDKTVVNKMSYRGRWGLRMERYQFSIAMITVDLFYFIIIIVVTYLCSLFFI